MAVQIMAVVSGSPADKAGIRPGEKLTAINQNQIEDILDYQFYMTDKKLKIDLLDVNGAARACDCAKRRI